MQKIIKKIYKRRQAIQEVKHKKALFVFFTFVLPCAYYLVLIGYFELMGLNEDDLPKIYTTLITSPFFIVPFYVALAFFSIVIFLKNIFGFGPSISTAPIPFNFLFSKLSTILDLYSFTMIPLSCNTIIHYYKIRHNIFT